MSLIYNVGSIVALQECTAMRVKDGEDRFLLTIYQKPLATEENDDPEWIVLAKGEMVYTEKTTIREHFASIKEEARKNFVKY